MNRVFLILMVFLLACQVSQRKSERPELCIDTFNEGDFSTLSFPDLHESKGLNNRQVQMEGIFSYAMEDVALYPIGDNKNLKGVWIEFDQKLQGADSLLTKLHGEKVVVSGTLDLSRKGHLSYYFCTLGSVVCIKKK